MAFKQHRSLHQATNNVKHDRVIKHESFLHGVDAPPPPLEQVELYGAPWCHVSEVVPRLAAVGLQYWQADSVPEGPLEFQRGHPHPGKPYIGVVRPFVG